jgi:hypothetical protein
MNEIMVQIESKTLSRYYDHHTLTIDIRDMVQFSLFFISRAFYANTIRKLFLHCLMKEND